MLYDSEKHHRQSTRLKEYDYTQPGAYFITVVAHQRRCLFGEVVNEEMQLSSIGQIVSFTWKDLPRHFQNARSDTFMVMPNHFHAIIWIDELECNPNQRQSSSKQISLSALVSQFKAKVTRLVQVTHPGCQVWQRGYYDRVIRSNAEFDSIAAYILGNPVSWAEDDEFPAE